MIKVQQTPVQHRGAAPSAKLVDAEVQQVAKSGRPSRMCLFVEVVPGYPEPTDPKCTEEGCRCQGREVDHGVWKREYLTPAKREAKAFLAEALGPDEYGELGAVWFSSRAGCGCGCSPGFVCEKVAEHDLHVRVNVLREQEASDA